MSDLVVAKVTESVTGKLDQAKRPRPRNARKVNLGWGKASESRYMPRNPVLCDRVIPAGPYPKGGAAKGCKQLPKSPRATPKNATQCSCGRRLALPGFPSLYIASRTLVYAPGEILAELVHTQQ